MKPVSRWQGKVWWVALKGEEIAMQADQAIVMVSRVIGRKCLSYVYKVVLRYRRNYWAFIYLFVISI